MLVIGAWAGTKFAKQHSKLRQQKWTNIHSSHVYLSMLHLSWVAIDCLLNWTIAVHCLYNAYKSCSSCCFYMDLTLLRQKQPTKQPRLLWNIQTFSPALIGTNNYSFIGTSVKSLIDTSLVKSHCYLKCRSYTSEYKGGHCTWDY